MKRVLLSLVAVLETVFCSLLFVAAPSFGQNSAHETVVINGKHALEGIWRFPPYWGSAIVRRLWTQYGPVPQKGAAWQSWGQESYCRIGTSGGEFTFDCFGSSGGERGHTTLDENGTVSLSAQNCDQVYSCGWRDYWVFRGRLSSNTELSGHMGLVHGGMLDEQPELLTATKIVLSGKSPDLGGQGPYLKRLLEEMANGKVTEPYTRQRLFSSNPDVVPIPDDWQSDLLKFLTPDDLRPLGKIRAVIYVGDYVPVWGMHKDLTGRYVYSNEQSSIYDVEFEYGERLCALHRQPDGVLNHFRCT